MCTKGSLIQRLFNDAERSGRVVQGGAQYKPMLILILLEGGALRRVVGVYRTHPRSAILLTVKLTNLLTDGVTEADVYDVDNNLSVNLFCTLTTLT